MKKILRVVRYEYKRLFLDRGRFWFLILSLICFASIIFFITLFWLNKSATADQTWTAELEARLVSMRDEAYENYLINMHLKEPTGPHFYSPPEPFLEEYNRLSYIIEQELANYRNGNSLSKYILSTRSYLQFYQNLVYIFFPVVISFNVYNTFIYDKNNGFSKNYATLGLRKRDLMIGKILYSGLFCLAWFMLFQLLGLVFSDDYSVLIFDGNSYRHWQANEWYFRRMGGQIIIMCFVYVLFYFLARHIKKGSTYLSVSTILIGLPFFLTLSNMILETQGGSVMPNYFPDLPYINVLVSDGFIGSHANYIFLLPFFISLGLIALSFILKRIKPSNQF